MKIHFKDFLHIWSGERSTHLIFDVTFTCEQSNDGWEKSIESHRCTFYQVEDESTTQSSNDFKLFVLNNQS